MPWVRSIIFNFYRAKRKVFRLCSFGNALGKSPELSGIGLMCSIYCDAVLWISARLLQRSISADTCKPCGLISHGFVKGLRPRVMCRSRPGGWRRFVWVLRRVRFSSLLFIPFGLRDRPCHSWGSWRLMASILADSLLRARPVFALPRTPAIDQDLVVTG
jgi:hypothetical protein